jgi:hypothetical protein
MPSATSQRQQWQLLTELNMLKSAHSPTSSRTQQRTRTECSAASHRGNPGAAGATRQSGEGTSVARINTYYGPQQPTIHEAGRAGSRPNLLGDVWNCSPQQHKAVCRGSLPLLWRPYVLCRARRAGTSRLCGPLTSCSTWRAKCAAHCLLLVARMCACRHPATILPATTTLRLQARPESSTPIHNMAGGGTMPCKRLAIPHPTTPSNHNAQ